MTKRKVALALAASIAVATPTVMVSQPAYAITKGDVFAIGMGLGVVGASAFCYFTGWCG